MIGRNEHPEEFFRSEEGRDMTTPERQALTSRAVKDPLIAVVLEYLERVESDDAERQDLISRLEPQVAHLEAEVERLKARIPSPHDLRRALRVIGRAESTGDVDAWDYQGVKDVLRAALTATEKEGTARVTELEGALGDLVSLARIGVLSLAEPHRSNADARVTQVERALAEEKEGM